MCQPVFVCLHLCVCVWGAASLFSCSRVNTLWYYHNPSLILCLSYNASINLSIRFIWVIKYHEMEWLFIPVQWPNLLCRHNLCAAFGVCKWFHFHFLFMYTLLCLAQISLHNWIMDFQALRIKHTLCLSLSCSHTTKCWFNKKWYSYLRNYDIIFRLN